MAGQMDNPLDGRGAAARCDAAIRSMAAAFQVDGIVSAWPDDGWLDEEDDDGIDDEDWIVGIALKSFGGNDSYAVTPGNTPGTWREFAKVRGRKLAEAFAELLNAVRAVPAEGR